MIRLGIAVAALFVLVACAGVWLARRIALLRHMPPRPYLDHGGLTLFDVLAAIAVFTAVPALCWFVHLGH